MLRIEIAQPCDMTWTAMRGDERVRHCGACRKNVYNISTMTEKEVEELIQRTEGHFCARVYRRTDGRVLTADCPRGVARARRRGVLKVSAAVAAATFLGSLAMPVYGGVRIRRHTLASPPVEPIPPTMGAPAVAIDHDEPPLTGKVAVPRMEMGDIVIPEGGK